MNLIDYLLFMLKVMALLSLILILFDIILDALIITPILKRNEKKKQLEIYDFLIEKLKNGDIETSIVQVDDDDKKIED